MSSLPRRSLERDRRQALQHLRPWVDGDADRFQGSHTKQRLRTPWPKQHSATGDLTHELNLTDGEREFLRRAVGQLALRITGRFDAQNLNGIGGNQRVVRSGVDEEQRRVCPL